jgi:hypothetical protein
MTSEDATCNWPNASVGLLKAANAPELFIKGAILCREPSVSNEHHLINDLISEYKRLFPDSSFKWNIPFWTEYLGIDETESEALTKSVPIPSLLYRYPVAKGDKKLDGAF